MLETLLSYVEYLRECYREARSEARTYLYALLIVVPLGLAQLLVSSLLHLSASTISTVVVACVRYVLAILAVVSTCLVTLVAVKIVEMAEAEREICALYNILTDPDMPKTRLWTLVVAAAALTAIVIACAVLAWLI